MALVGRPRPGAACSYRVHNSARVAGRWPASKFFRPGQAAQARVLLGRNGSDMRPESDIASAEEMPALSPANRPFAHWGKPIAAN